MIPATLQVRCNEFLKNLKKTTITNKELHLLIDLVKLEEVPHMIEVLQNGDKKYTFGFFIFNDDKERDEFFNDPKQYSEYFDEKIGRRQVKLSKQEIKFKLEVLGFDIEMDRIVGYKNPVKVEMILDKIQNKKDKYYYGVRARS